MNMVTITKEIDLDEVDISPSGMDEYIDTHKAIVERDGEKLILFGYGYHSETDNPCENDCGMGTMYSFNRRHINCLDPDDINSTILARHRKWAVPLSYFEHGNCLWDVQSGERIGRCPDMQWDGTELAGIWVPNDNLLECMYMTYRSWKKEKGLTKVSKEDRQKKYAEIMRKYAAQCCEVYTQWCNGETYGYSVALYDALGDEVDDLDSCGGFIGRETVAEALEESFEREKEKLSK